MQASVERKSGLRAPLLVGFVAGLHIVAVGAFLFMQGCGTTKVAVEPPPAPVMPPKPGAGEPVPPVMPRPVVQPPVAVESAPTGVEGAGQTYQVASGDSLSKIAARFGVSAREIMELNKIKDANKIRIGQKLLLPSYASEQAPSATAAKKPAAKPAVKQAAKPKPAPVAGAGEYIVKSGDSLSKIASRNGTTVKALREANNLKSDMIRINQKLVLPGHASAPAASAPAAVESAPAAPASAPSPVVEPAAAPVAVAPAAPSAPAAPVAVAPPADPLASAEVSFEYVLKPGENLDDVAKQFAVLKQDIMTMNGITDASTVSGGTRLKIPMASP